MIVPKKKLCNVPEPSLSGSGDETKFRIGLSDSRYIIRVTSRAKSEMRWKQTSDSNCQRENFLASGLMRFHCAQLCTLDIARDAEKSLLLRR